MIVRRESKAGTAGGPDPEKERPPDPEPLAWSGLESKS